MLKLLVLEDRQDTREVLTKLIENVSDEIKVLQTGNLEEARKCLLTEEGIDGFLLDINLDTSSEEDISGIVFAREIRKLTTYQFTPIVMITSVANLEMRAYRELHCYQYIIKPFHKGEVASLVKKLLVSKEKQEVKTVTVKKNGISYVLNCAEIQYIQAIPRGVCIFMKGDSIRVPYVSIKQILEKLPSEEFVQCHRMYVINTAYIDYIDIVNQIIHLKGCETLLEIGVTYKSSVRRLINE